MKTHYILLIGLFLVTSCNSPEQKNDNIQEPQKTETDKTVQNESSDIHTKISNQWILVKRKSLKRDTTVNFSAIPPSIITQFKISGFFSISDLIKINSDQEKKQKLVSRNTGQWELNDNRLLMRYGTSDTIRTFEIIKLDEDSLTLKDIENNYVNTYTKRK